MSPQRYILHRDRRLTPDRGLTIATLCNRDCVLIHPPGRLSVSISSSTSSCRRICLSSSTSFYLPSFNVLPSLEVCCCQWGSPSQPSGLPEPPLFDAAESNGHRSSPLRLRRTGAGRACVAALTCKPLLTVFITVHRSTGQLVRRNSLTTESGIPCAASGNRAPRRHTS